ncbi:MAG TPA: GNAT family N-acetyltransferase [Ktedonobacterales bacterium]|nr:GNAT family N-acetyltransferase [Ktedonobacterales bacterium]
MRPAFALLSNQDRKAFRCGEPPLDRYLQQQASQDVKRGLAACHVLVDLDNPLQIIGYYTLSNTTVLLDELPQPIQKTARPYSRVPAVLIGRLAVDITFQGRGIGDVLLGDALRRILRLSREVGSKLVIVDALNENVIGFYARREFQRLPDQPLRLFLPVTKVSDIFPKADAPTS